MNKKCKYYLDLITLTKHLSEKFIRRYLDYINWDYLSQFQKLSEDFIIEFEDKINWDDISSFQILSENFIRKYKDRLNWTNICRDQNLSESFIEEFKEYIDWEEISYKFLTPEFIFKYRDKLDIHAVLVSTRNLPIGLLIYLYIDGYCKNEEILTIFSNNDNIYKKLLKLFNL